MCEGVAKISITHVDSILDFVVIKLVNLKINVWPQYNVRR